LNKRLNIFVLISLLFFTSTIYSQNKKDDLQKSKKAIEDEIKYTSKLLQETKKNKEVSLNQIQLLKNQINKREYLIETINNQVSSIDEEIINNASSLEELTNQLQKYREEYAKIVYYLWKNRKTYDKLVFLLAADNFNQGYRRFKYLQLYSEYRKRQAELIIATQNKIYGKVEELKTNKEEKESLLTNQQKEKNRLAAEKEEKSKNVNKLKKKETELRKTLKEKEKINNKLKSSIQNLINEEIRKANENKTTKKSSKITKNKIVEKKDEVNKTNKKDKVNTKKEEVSNNTISLTTEESELSNSFLNSKGKLPWPVENGVLSSSFGEHPHSVLTGVVVKNNGIDIITQSGMQARSVFGGVVSGIISLPNGAKAVIIRHGDYLTVYSNLSSVNVQNGSKVRVKQLLGTIRTDSDDSKTELHFELWHNKEIQNPSNWVKR